MKRLCDLHTHTTASDGSFTPEESVRYARQKGALALAITDHDTLGGLERAVAEGERIGQRVIPGVEITTKLEGCEIHMVGLFIRWQDEDFARQVNRLSLTRDERNQRMVQKLIDNGFRITAQDLEQFRGRVLTKAHIGQILVERGYAANVTEAMNTFLRKGGVAYVERQTPTPRETIDLIHRGGGLAFVAHTNQIDKTDRDHSCRVCQQLLEMGAVNVYSFGPVLLHACLRSGGSDFHGTFKAGLDMLTGYGDLEVPYEFVEAMEARLQK